MGGAEDGPQGALPLGQRSYLGHVLPESLLYCLHTYGPHAFADALCGDHDTPELVWTHGMRFGRLLPQLAAHLGDLRPKLAQCCTFTQWDYTPAPPITYPEIQVR